MDSHMDTRTDGCEWLMGERYYHEINILHVNVSIHNYIYSPDDRARDTEPYNNLITSIMYHRFNLN